MGFTKIFYIALIQSIILISWRESDGAIFNSFPIFKGKGSSVKANLGNGVNLIGNMRPVQTIGNGIQSVITSDPVQVIGNGIEQGIGGIGQGIGQGIEEIGKGIESVKNLLDPSKFLDGIDIKLPDPEELGKQVGELVKTTAVFLRNNESLNCFGLPIKGLEKPLEMFFMQQTKAEDVKFYFSSRRGPNYIMERVKDSFTLNDIDFDIRRPTVLMVHGFMSSGQESWLKEMKDAYLELDNINAIVVDWQQGSNTWNYYSAALNTRIVGLQIAKLFAKIRGMALEAGQSEIKQWGTIYFIGHSLGSHISAHAAYLIKQSQENQTESWTVGRITGLDPAQPCFTTAEPSLRLDQGDAPFVDVIHTNARNWIFLGLGLPDPAGFVDFYPNGGKAQPGCSKIDASIWNFPLIPIDIIKESMCSHGRSHEFYTESLVDLYYNNCTFDAFKWDGKYETHDRLLEESCEAPECTRMGLLSRNDYPRNPGKYFVPTKRDAPFCGTVKNEPTNFNADPSKKEPNSNIVTGLSDIFLPPRY